MEERSSVPWPKNWVTYLEDWLAKKYRDLRHGRRREPKKIQLAKGFALSNSKSQTVGSYPRIDQTSSEEWRAPGRFDPHLGELNL